MKKINSIFNYRIVILFVILNFVSCSKDSDDPSESEITVTTADFSKTMDENPANGQVIGTVSGSTNKGTLTFSITEQNPSGAFSIDPTSGELKVADETLFDFETNPTITGTVKVANGAISKNALVTISLNDTNDENIFEGTIYLRSQQEVNDFGANNYTRITGDLLIGRLENEGYSDITDLSPLSALQKIDRHLYIDYNGELTTTADLDNLSFLGENLAFINNPSLINLDGLTKISSNIAGDLIITYNPVLSNLNAISNISTVGGQLFITFCPQIANLNWLSNLVSVEKTFSLFRTTEIQNFNSLSNLQNIGGLSVHGNSSLINFDGLQNLNGSIEVLTIGGNSSLSSLQGLENINVTGGIVISANNSLENINALTRVTELTSSLTVNGNEILNDLNGLNNLTSVAQFIDIYQNENLNNLNGLENLIFVDDLSITSNDNLTDFCALQNLFINGNVRFYRVFNNAHNPKEQDIIDGNCSL